MQMLDSGKELTANEHEWTRMETKKFTEKRKETRRKPEPQMHADLRRYAGFGDGSFKVVSVVFWTGHLLPQTNREKFTYPLKARQNQPAERRSPSICVNLRAFAVGFRFFRSIRGPSRRRPCRDESIRGSAVILASFTVNKGCVDGSVAGC
jgi:hypothetical protein